MNTSKRVALPLLFSISIFLLSGCVRMNVDLEVNKDQTINGTMVYAISDSLASLAGGDNMANQTEIFNSKTKGVSTVPYKQDGFTGQKYILKNVPFSAFKSTDKNSTFNFKKEGNLIIVSGVIDLSNSQDGETDAMAQSIAKSMFAAADIHISVKFPYDIKESSGEISADHRTVTWRPKMGEKTDLSATVTIPSTNYIKIAGGAFALICFFLIFAAFIRGKNKSEENMNE